MITFEDFLEYYNFISACVEDDKYFDLMINGVWNVQKVAYGKGWGAHY